VRSRTLTRIASVAQPRRVSADDVFVTQEVDMRAIKWVGCAAAALFRSRRVCALCRRLTPRCAAAPPRACASMNWNHNVCVWRPAALERIYQLAAAHLVAARSYPESVLQLKCAPRCCAAALLRRCAAAPLRRCAAALLRCCAAGCAAGALLLHAHLSASRADAQIRPRVLRARRVSGHAPRHHLQAHLPASDYAKCDARRSIGALRGVC
jgi:hypothetical protein